MKNKINLVLKIIVTIIFLSIPIVDMLRITPFKDIELFGITIIELFYIVLVFMGMLLTFFKIPKKKFLPIVIYTVIFILFLILHNLNITKFNEDILINSNINAIQESFYLFRVYYLPILLLDILINNRDILNKQYYLKIIKILIGFISISIIVLNILKLSYASYDANNAFVKYNIFDFFKSELSGKLLSTRGLFSSANELSIVLFMFLPINICLLMKEKKWFNYTLFITQFIAMIILGTKISAFGAITVSIFAIFINILMHFSRKSTIKYGLIITTVICSCYLFISPFGKYVLYEKKSDFSINNQEAYEELKQANTEEEIIMNINNYHYEYKINEEFLKMYPVEKDPFFWKNIALRDKRINNDNRKMKLDISRRVKEKNNNSNDTIYGMGYTTNLMDMEKDYIFQYYIFGILGLITLISPYILILCKNYVMILRKIKNMFNQYTAFYAMPPLLGLIAAYLSGHLFGWTMPIYMLVLMIELLCVDVKENING